MKNKFLCPLPWNSLSLAPNSISRVCCHQNGVLKNSSTQNFSELIQLKHNEKIKLQMLKNEIPPECIECYSLEKTGCPSPRLHYLKLFNINEVIAEPKIEYLDITIDNRCNLECIMCSPHFSYRLNTFFNKQFKSENIDLWELAYSNSEIDLLLPNLKMLKVTGGEVFFSSHAMKFLTHIIESGHSSHINLRLFTNLSIIPKNLEDILNSFHSVEFIISIDSIEDNYEFIRYPAKWSTININISKILKLKLSNTAIFLHSVIMANNWTFISELIRYFYKMGLNKYSPLPIFVEIENPVYLHPKVLPPNEFDLGMNKIIQCLKEIIPDVGYEQKEISNFLSLIEKIKERDCKNNYIEYRAYMNKIKNHREN